MIQMNGSDWMKYTNLCVPHLTDKVDSKYVIYYLI